MILVCCLTVQPGYVPMKTLADSDNVISVVCKEFEQKSAQKLTQLDEMCLTCLSPKYIHVEHCVKCNRCVKNFHMHSRYYNKCFGENNIRLYVNFLLF